MTQVTSLPPSSLPYPDCGSGPSFARRSLNLFHEANKILALFEALHGLLRQGNSEHHRMILHSSRMELDPGCGGHAPPHHVRLPETGKPDIGPKVPRVVNV